ncbi:hypothetical protein JAAARDRAFT_155555 [Jaapia argillacea MUCL 33604]|uniref:Actin-like ATPase domain-containing protein n=1 Tax=Jaapia argillacea MUCL 33604 TaxID=933084 RepID=A0A067PT41_9AGAM|nr:hypothetical protein JAAARDRAFT_155555 [Jaapia argillacea MUCL 33604]
MAQNIRVPYTGKGKRLLVSIDVGTTFSAASFCILREGQVPKFEEILRWPAQATPDAKVPSVIYYDSDGNVCAVGAQTENEEQIVEAEEGSWFKAEWWKLHLRPSHLPLIRDLELPPLPEGKSADQVFADYLSFVKQQVKEYITTTYGDGHNLWALLSPSMYVILTTPNRWEGSQQNKMRNAAISAGLVAADSGRRVRFVTEAEAAVLYAVDSGCVGDWLVENGNLILCDCGGGTIDITGYSIASLTPLRLEESSASRCYLAGAVFVTQAAKEYLKNKLAGTEWESDEAIQRALFDFDKNAKRRFNGPETTSWVNLHGFKTIAHLGIVRGRLKIPGNDMVRFFEPSLTSIKQGLEIAFENGDKLADKVILVGGLASSPYVYSELVAWGAEMGISVSRPDGPTTKAVANGALAWFVDNSIRVRVSKYEYGTPVNIPYDKNCKDSQNRPTVVEPDGTVSVSKAWNVILPKNSQVESEREFIKPYYVTQFEKDGPIALYRCDIYVYRRAKAPKFVTFPGKGTLQPGFEKICSIEGDLSRCLRTARLKVSKITGQKYRDLAFDVCLALGSTELSARMRWAEDGKHVYGSATIAYD